MARPAVLGERHKGKSRSRRPPRHRGRAEPPESVWRRLTIALTVFDDLSLNHLRSLRVGLVVRSLGPFAARVKGVPLRARVLSRCWAIAVLSKAGTLEIPHGCEAAKEVRLRRSRVGA